MSTPTPNPDTSFDMGDGFMFKVNVNNPKINPLTHVGCTYPKESRPAIGSKEERDLIDGITTNQHTRYKMMTTSVKDAENLRTNLSIHQLLEETRACWERYDLLDPCNILFPTTANPVIPELEAGVVKRRDLFAHYRLLTADEVAASCEYYQKYITFKGTTAECTFAKELAWSYNYFRNHVETSLFDTINAEFRMYSPSQQGGPLFLKLLLDELVVSNEANLQALILTTTTYDIKSKNSEDEDIVEVVKLLSSISETILAIRNDDQHPLPEQYVQNICKVFQTTSCEAYNTSIRKLEEDVIFNRRYKKTAKSNRLQARRKGTFLPSTTSTNLQLINDIESLEFLWQFALETYKELKEDGQWDDAMRGTKQPASSFTTGVRCWNCDGPHNVRKCPKPRDEERIQRNRQAYKDNIKSNSNSSESQSQSSQRRWNAARWVWRPPLPEEGGKRIIFDKPYTWNPTTERWDLDDTPASGLSVQAPNPPTTAVRFPVPTGQPVDDASASLGQCHVEDDSHTVMTASTVNATDLAHIQLEMAHLHQKLNQLLTP